MPQISWESCLDKEEWVSPVQLLTHPALNRCLSLILHIYPLGRSCDCQSMILGFGWLTCIVFQNQCLLQWQWGWLISNDGWGSFSNIYSRNNFASKMGQLFNFSMRIFCCRECWMYPDIELDSNWIDSFLSYAIGTVFLTFTGEMTPNHSIESSRWSWRKRMLYVSKCCKFWHAPLNGGRYSLLS